VTELVAALVAAGFDEDTLSDVLKGPPADVISDPVIAMERLRAAPPSLQAIVELLLVGLKVAPERIPDDVFHQLRDAKLLERAARGVRARVSLVPWHGLVIAADPRPRGAPSADLVTGINRAAETLAYVTPREQVGSALDLGTGGGVQALLAARHSSTVIGTDVNPRALAIAELNGRLNGVHATWLEGSWYEPVAGRTFDLIVANPPYVLSPSSDFIFRDAGSGDGASAAAVRGAAAHLSDSGTAVVLINWGQPAGGDWTGAVRGWLEGSNCDAVVIRYATLDPVEYATAWNAPLRGEPERFATELSRWVEHHRDAGIETVGMGAVAMRPGEGRLLTLEAATAPTGPAGTQLSRILDELQRAAGDESLLASVLMPPDGWRFTQTVIRRDGRNAAAPAKVTLEPGLGIELAVDRHLLPILHRLDGECTLAEAVADRPLRRKAVAAVRDLLARGMLVRR
jgi:methylase of polypeptide subunit release factors